MKKEYTKKQILESKQLLNEDKWENALMIAGFVPVVGEIADIALIITYVIRKQYLYAGLMLIALIPTVGDFIAKPIINLLKSPLAKGALKNADNLVAYAAKNPEFAKKYVQIGKYLNSAPVTGTIKNLEKVPVVGSKVASGLRHSVSEHASAIGRILQRPAGLAKQVGSEISKKGAPGFLKTITGGGPVASGLKNYFKGEKLAKYVAKNGMEPGNWLSRWWNITRPARSARRNFFKSFIVSNNLLDYFGLPSIGAFEEKFENNAEFRKQVAEVPGFEQVVEQSTTPEQFAQINQNQLPQQQSTNMGGEYGLSFLKLMAQRY